MKNAPQDGGPAFPVPVSDATDGRTHDGGMSLRDWFAGQALMGLSQQDMSSRATADLAYDLADAMLAARKDPTA